MKQFGFLKYALFCENIMSNVDGIDGAFIGQIHFLSSRAKSHWANNPSILTSTTAAASARWRY